MPTTAFSKELFEALLDTLTPLRSTIGTLVKIALDNLSHNRDVSDAVLDRLTRSEPDSMECQALWYLLDALMKAMPLTFVPLFAPQLVKLVEAQLPWQLLQQRRHIDKATGKEVPVWFEAMVGTWDTLLGRDVFQQVQKMMSRQRSSRELQRELAFAESLAQRRHRKEGNGGVDAASTQQLARLDKEWGVFRRLLAKEAMEVEATDAGAEDDADAANGAPEPTAAEQPEVAPEVSMPSKPKSVDRAAEANISSSSDDSDDDEFCPTNLDGAGEGNVGGWDDDDEKRKGKRVARTRKR